MKIGAHYYPEQWPQAQWESDFDRMAAMGLQIVHLGEFAWFSLEPAPGKFQFDWLKRTAWRWRRAAHGRDPLHADRRAPGLAHRTASGGASAR